MSLSAIEIVNRALTKIGSKRISSLDDPIEEAAVAKTMFDIVRDAELMSHSWTFAKRRMLLAAEDVKPVWGWELQYLLPSFCLRLLEVAGWPASSNSNLTMSENRPFVQEHNRILTNRQYLMDVGCLCDVTDPELPPADDGPDRPPDPGSLPFSAVQFRGINTAIALASQKIPAVSVDPTSTGLVDTVPFDSGDSIYQASFGINSTGCGCMRVKQALALPILYIHKEEVTAHWHPLFTEAFACKLAIELCERLSGDTSKRELAWREYDRAIATARQINALGMPPKVLQDGTWMVAHMRGVM